MIVMSLSHVSLDGWWWSYHCHTCLWTAGGGHITVTRVSGRLVVVVSLSHVFLDGWWWSCHCHTCLWTADGGRVTVTRVSGRLVVVMSLSHVSLDTAGDSHVTVTRVSGRLVVVVSLKRGSWWWLCHRSVTADGVTRVTGRVTVMTVFQAQLDDMCEALEAASRLSEQLDRKEEAISALREEGGSPYGGDEEGGSPYWGD